MKTRTLMVQGTSSHCGKTLMVAALCRLYGKAGFKVAPFKAQNMSLNSYVTENKEEISRAQALQAFAAGVEPTVDMNPILLKPKGNMTSQIVLLGKPYADIDSARYYTDFAMKTGLATMKKSLAHLMANYEIIVIEGAGSPAEINLYHVDIANMAVAEASRTPVLLVSDIDRGGAFASIIGTMQLLEQNHRDLVKGFVFNKFRGDKSLLHSGILRLEQMTKVPVLGIVPFIEQLQLPQEDSVSLDEINAPAGRVDIAVLRLPHISNFTDFDILRNHPAANVRFVKTVENLGMPDLLILPGTKNTIEDLLWLKDGGFIPKIEHLAQDRLILGICGGYQMLGNRILDANAIEGKQAGSYEGLGLLDVETTFESYDKITRRVTAEVVSQSPILKTALGNEIHGYHIHMGKTNIGENSRPLFRLKGSEHPESTEFDGASSEKGLVLGTNIHGLLDEPSFREAIFQSILAQKKTRIGSGYTVRASDVWTRNIELLATVVRENMNLNKVCEIMSIPQLKWQ
ncbi:MAG: cobyric acid synthase [Candidatus Bathyarchaeia archaeon]